MDIVHRPPSPDHDPVGYVLDSSVLLAHFFGEPEGDVLRSVAGISVVSAVTLGETLTKLQRRGTDSDIARQRLLRWELPVIPWTEDLVWQADDLCPLAWTHGLSFADRACLATARALGRTALTADAVWPEAVRGLARPVKVQLIRRSRR